MWLETTPLRVLYYETVKCDIIPPFYEQKTNLNRRIGYKFVRYYVKISKESKLKQKKKVITKASIMRLRIETFRWSQYYQVIWNKTNKIDTYKMLDASMYLICSRIHRWARRYDAVILDIYTYAQTARHIPVTATAKQKSLRYLRFVFFFLFW